MELSNHPITAEDLMAYLDGELPAAEAAQAEAHLAGCRECQAVAADLQSVSRNLAAWDVRVKDGPLPNELRKALELQRSSRPKRTAFRSHTWVWVCAPAVLLVIALPVWQRFANTRQQADKFQRTAGLIGSAPHAADAQEEPSSPPRFARGGVAGGVVGGVIGGAPAVPPPAPSSKLPAGPLVVRTAELALTAHNFSEVRESITRLVAARQGYIAQLQMSTPANESRSLTATLRVPSTQLDLLLNDIKGLGRVETESQRGEEVTQQAVDLDARLKNLRTTETRLIDILRNRTGRLADVLQVEEQVDRTRGEIEVAEAEQKSLHDRVAFARLELRVSEVYKADLNLDRPSISARVRNAGLKGLKLLGDTFMGVLLWFLTAGPTLLVLAAVLLWPARWLWRKTRPLS